MESAHNGPVEIVFEEFGPVDGQPVLLISGAATPMIFWPDSFLEALSERGYRGVRFDNRDSGASTHCTGLPAYDLHDMAGDAVAVLDAAGLSSAHVLGVSLGGMVGQVMAVHWPQRVRSLVSLSASPAWSWQLLRPRLRTMARIATVYLRHRAGTREDEIAKWVRLFPLMGSPAYPVDEGWIRDTVGRAYDIAYDPAGERRQQAAITACGDRRAELAGVRAPTLVVHGEIDPLQSVRAGRAAAEAIPGARLVTFADAGHGLPPEVYWSQLLDAMDDVTGLTRPDRRE